MNTFSVNSNDQHYSLSIRFTSDGFSLLISDENQFQISTKNVSFDLFSKSEEDFLDLLDKELELNINYQAIRIIFETDLYSVIPKPLFNTETAKELLNLQHHNINPTDIILHNELLAWDAVLVFAIPVAVNSVMSKILPEIKIEHHIYSFITDSVALQNDPNMHVWVRQNIMDVVILDKGNLRLIKSFNFTTTEDFVYYIMSLFELLPLDTEQCQLVIYNSKKQPKLIELTSKYIKHCKSAD